MCLLLALWMIFLRFTSSSSSRLSNAHNVKIWLRREKLPISHVDVVVTHTRDMLSFSYVTTKEETHSGEINFRVTLTRTRDRRLFNFTLLRSRDTRNELFASVLRVFVHTSGPQVETTEEFSRVISTSVVKLFEDYCPLKNWLLSVERSTVSAFDQHQTSACASS